MLAALAHPLLAHPLAALPLMGNTNGTNGSPDPLSTVATLLIFIGIPLLVIVVVAGLVLPQGKGKAVTYRPGRPWSHPRSWFGTVPPDQTDVARVGVPGIGGSSAQW